jgi:hypothetical protein
MEGKHSLVRIVDFGRFHPTAGDNLLNVHATAENITKDVDTFFPVLSSSKPEIIEFTRRIKQQQSDIAPQSYPEHVCSPTTWPATDSFMDSW